MARTKVLVLPKEYWKPPTVALANEVGEIAEETAARVYVPGILFGSVEEIKASIDLWRKKLSELIEDVKRYED